MAMTPAQNGDSNRMGGQAWVAATGPASDGTEASCHDLGGPDVSVHVADRGGVAAAFSGPAVDSPMTELVEAASGDPEGFALVPSHLSAISPHLSCLTSRERPSYAADRLLAHPLRFIARSG